MIRALLVLAGLVLVAMLAVSAWVRLAPDDPARWHVALAFPEPAAPGPCADTVARVLKGARASCLLPGTPAETLARLDGIALSCPRTTRLAGSPQSGRITWVSRSLIFGFPDYITAEADAAGATTRLDVLSRQRYGGGDMGVNAARLKAWLAQL